MKSSPIPKISIPLNKILQDQEIEILDEKAPPPSFFWDGDDLVPTWSREEVQKAINLAINEAESRLINSLI